MNDTPRMPERWDYLILTASNDQQAAAYETQVRWRVEAGHLARVREALVVADIEGKRIGSGGSTLQCLNLVLERERRRGRQDEPAEEVFRKLRILIVHAGGDSRRLPAYGPCGKIFVPLPGESFSALGSTIFDRLVPLFLDLPPGLPGAGQVVIAAGDALNRFDTQTLRLDYPGMTALGCYASPEEAARHGVFCLDEDHSVRLFLQKPSLEEQAELGAISRFGKTPLDIGVMSFDAAAAAALLEAFSGDVWPLVVELGVDFYREICCAMGAEATFERYVRSARGSGSQWSEEQLAQVLPKLRRIPFRARLAPRCHFLHFGSTRQLVASGLALLAQDMGAPPVVTTISVNNQLEGEGAVAGSDSWVEGCRLRAPLLLAGRNVAVGVDVNEQLALPRGACLEVVKGHSRTGAAGWFVRCYGVDDTFKDAVSKGGTFCGAALSGWMEKAGVRPEDLWEGTVPEPERTLWNARVFPFETSPDGYRRWLWMFDPGRASAAQKQEFLTADRYSAAEVAWLADQDDFHLRRAAIRAWELGFNLQRMFSRESAFSAADLAFALKHSGDPADLANRVWDLAQEYDASALRNGGLENFTFCRIAHTLGSALEASGVSCPGLNPDALRAMAFTRLHETILKSSLRSGERPRNALRPDETIWGRGPARIELGGGWTDTPPYTLEFGGDVANVAVNLNGQPPIHCYCRVIEEPVIRIASIDGGGRTEIRELEELLDYRRPEDPFALAKAALAISGFSPGAADWPPGTSLQAMLEEFGGGIELTTLVGIPKGSGLGTSSILGAVIMAVIGRLMGRSPSHREIFHDVLRLEQALTTGGGWQDQIGGGVGGVKITSTKPGMFPDPRIHYLPGDLLDPKFNGGTTLLYYTGLTRLAKNILQEIVGKYFDRNRSTMAALAEEHLVARCVADSLARKDAEALGHYIDVAWELQKRLCGFVTNEAIESLLARVRPHVHGMRISGAGSGGFLLMICKSPGDAAEIRRMLEREPLNERSRFFDYEINHAGVEVTTC